MQNFPPIGRTFDTRENRDAIHIAIVPVFATESVSPGQHVALLGDGLVSAYGTGEKIGIVDPFIKGTVEPGQQFFVFLYPGTVTSLRHEWTHPAFDELAKAAKAESEQWLREFCQRVDCPPYEIVIVAASGGDLQPSNPVYGPYAYENDGEFLHFNGWDAHSEIPAEFWLHVEVVTGKRIAKRAKYFSCSC